MVLLIVRELSFFQHYQIALDLLQMIIIATDLANHFLILKDIDEIAKGT